AHKVNKVKNSKIIILDDIYTTGATANSCAKTLKESGAKKIYVLTLLFAGNRHHLMVK
ncbi:MAG: ComF family protein, partial [Firmicutes bacterium]|nr:ComF family protein [Bacillota bacterium]